MSKCVLNKSHLNASGYGYSILEAGVSGGKASWEKIRSWPRAENERKDWMELRNT